MIKASICTIGDEILIGQVVDTNSSNISLALNEIGVKVSRMVSIGDERNCIIGTLARELSENDIVIVTGGLGPTKDDITKNALAELSESTASKMDERQLEIIHNLLSARGLDVLDINIAQASVPDTCEVIPNRLGTAPIMVFTAIFVLGYMAIWAVIYYVNKRSTDRINVMLKKQQEKLLQQKKLNMLKKLLK